MKNDNIVKKNYKNLCQMETDFFNTCIITHPGEKYKCNLFKTLMEDCNIFKNMKQRRVELNEIKERKIEKNNIKN